MAFAWLEGRAGMAAGPAGAIPDAAELRSSEVRFNRDVRPILSENCFLCHGPDAAARQAGLRLDRRESALATRRGVTPIVPGDLERSELLRRIFHPDPEERMPPPESQRSLTDEERRLLARWILQGAEYEPHWAYLPPRRGRLPEVEGAKHPTQHPTKHPIDRFIVARLAEERLVPSPEADPVTLVRRLSFDLLGLPPRVEQVDRFLTARQRETEAGGTGDAAYGELVDELLASPHFGERMAIDWLDLVRYADTNGYHSDETRSVSPYRDYVIRAFNDNLPYDRFTIEQLAGDLLPAPTTEQRIAATFNRLNQLTAEGGAQSMEYRAKYDADRVRALGSVWLGATLGCAECHDHKFDPFSQRDFYSFAAFFADIEEHDVYSTGETWDPILYLPTAAERAELEELEARIAEHSKAIASADLEAGVTAFIESVGSRAPSARGWHPVGPSRLRSTGGATLERLDDFSLLASGQNPERDTYELTLPTRLTGITGLRLEMLGHPSLNGGLGRAGRAPLELAEVEVELLGADGAAHPIEIVAAEDDRKFYGAAAELVIDGTTSSRWMVKATRPLDDRVQAVFTFAEPIAGGEGTTLRVRLVQHGLNKRVAIGRFRLALTRDPRPAVGDGAVGIPEPILDAVAGSAAMEPQDRERILSYYRTLAPELEWRRREIGSAEERRLELRTRMLSTLETRALETPRTTRVLRRGDWQDTAGEVVEPAVPTFLPPLAVEEGRATRLDLARWLVDRDNPLTARVLVNRLWRLFFGRGLSAVLDDLGLQGEWPTHPELLDWLAVELVESGWDVKQTVRLMVTSATYRQASSATPELRQRDPDNRWLARQSRRRLEAEMVRDNALAVSGLLSAEVGGRSVRPYQPDGYWRNANTFGGESLDYTPSVGKEQYRRGLYTFWKRSFLHPSLLAFDAPSREECTADRPVSNTPLQALVLLNDPSFVEAARVLAERTLTEVAKGSEDRLVSIFRRVLSRRPEPEELELLQGLLDEHRVRFAADPEAGRRLVSTGQWPLAEGLATAELAAWISVARTLLNLPETITRF